MLIKCPECGHQVSDQARTCPSCGIDIAGKITRCPDCGEVIFKEQKSCPNCHCSINAAATPMNPTPMADNPGDSSPTPAGERREGTSTPAPAATPGMRRAKATPTASTTPSAGERREGASRKPKRTYTALIVAFVLVLIAVFLGFYFYKNTQEQNELRAYQNAVRSAEPAVLQNFLDMYKDAPKQHRDSVEMHLAALKKIESDWTEAVLTGSKAEIEKYMNRYPQSVHITEAKLKIDSLDWVAAEAEGTQQAYQRYMDAHDDGAHYDDARDRYERMEAQKVNNDDRQMVIRLFSTFFRALAQRDEALLTPTLAPVLTSFLHKEQATKVDVLHYMDRIHEMDITAMEFTPNNDWHIEKKPVGANAYTYTYTVDFTVDQKMERTNPERERFCTYKVNAAISDDGKITELNMKRAVPSGGE